MSKNSWGFELPDSIWETQRIIRNMTSAFETWNRIGRDFSYMQNVTGAVAAVESYQSILKSIIPMDTATSLLASASSMQSVLAGLQIPKTVDLIPTMERILPIIDDAWKMPTIDWNWMSETLSTYGDDFNQDESGDLLTEEIREELDESIHEIMVSGDSEEVVKSKFLEWQNRHPVLAFVLIQILLAIIINIASGVIGDWVSGVLTKKSNMYEEATATSNVVINIDVDQNITVINEVPYYYEIIYTDPETGEERRGYVYKANVAIEQEEPIGEETECLNIDTQ